MLTLARRNGPMARAVQCPTEIITYECSTNQPILTWTLPQENDTVMSIPFVRGSQINLVQTTPDNYFDVYLKDSGNLSSILVSFYNPGYNGRNISCTARDVTSRISLKFAGKCNVSTYTCVVAALCVCTVPLSGPCNSITLIACIIASSPGHSQFFNVARYKTGGPCTRGQVTVCATYVVVLS